MSERIPRGRAAVAAWPARFLSVMFDPTDENLQRLCSLLDAIDAWVVDRWAPGNPRHDGRMATLRACRADARVANRAVTEAIRGGQAERGRAIRAKQAETVDK